jgi:BirA family biotin operon repressor/biotin-[acetyl-CoA-carboxylase] ligase
VTDALASHDLVGRVRVLASCDSTNAEARRLLGSGSGAVPGSADSSWLLVTAEEQTGGRGRLDRSWTSPAGAGVLMSLAVAIPATAAATTVGWLPLIAGLATAAACRRLAVPAAVKWPNDVVVGDPARKLAGVLVERSGVWAVVGIGINVDLKPSEFPTATTGSLVSETGAALLDRGARWRMSSTARPGGGDATAGDAYVRAAREYLRDAGSAGSGAAIRVGDLVGRAVI